MRNRRNDQRLKVLKEAKIMLTDWHSVDCLVRDIGTGGARLEFSGPVYLPKQFRLRIVSGNVTIPAEPVWQRRGEAGIRFTGIATAGCAELPPRFVRPVAA